MTDIALALDLATGSADLVLAGGRLATDDGMRTAILLSLFTDARAPDGAELPEPGADRRGWWGDAFSTDAVASASGAIGSTMWLLRRAKITPDTLQRARQAATSALAWLIADGVASAIDVAVEAQGDRLAIAISLNRPGGPARQRYDFTWEASTGDLVA